LARHTSSIQSGSFEKRILDRERTSALVRRGQAGDADAFAEIVRAYQDLAVAYATSILSDCHLAEDAARESFVEANRALPALREPAAFGAWFRRIVFKHCDRVTRRKRLPSAGLDAALAIATPEPSPHDVLERPETARISFAPSIPRISPALTRRRVTARSSRVGKGWPFGHIVGRQ
jgi:RNA polymerase sigma-70 factor (ECF subfamily)